VNRKESISQMMAAQRTFWINLQATADMSSRSELKHP
jgi:hypothetical protein